MVCVCGALSTPLAGRLLPSSVSVLSNTVAAGMRTVVLSRPALLPGGDHANFSMTQLQLPFISAVGSTAALSYHKAKTAATLALWPSAGQRSLCLCAMPAAAYGKAAGTIKYLPTGEQFGFTNFCQPEPRESVLAQRNPTCDYSHTCTARIHFPPRITALVIQLHSLSLRFHIPRNDHPLPAAQV